MQKEKLLSKKMKELSGFIHLNLGNWRFFVSERILTSSPSSLQFLFYKYKVVHFKEILKAIIRETRKGTSFSTTLPHIWY